MHIPSAIVGLLGKGSMSALMSMQLAVVSAGVEVCVVRGVAVTLVGKIWSGPSTVHCGT